MAFVAASFMYTVAENSQKHSWLTAGCCWYTSLLGELLTFLWLDKALPGSAEKSRMFMVQQLRRSGM
jgi:hypothetical protein